MSDPFQLLGVEATFELDLARLEARHRELSRALHPDRFAGRPASERRQALSRAIEVNEAFRALRDPLRRAELLLARRGVAHAEGQEPKPDPSFLMQVMELREALSDAKRAHALERLSALRAEVLSLESDARRRLGALLAEPELRGADAAQTLGELRYYRRFLEEAALAEDEIG